MIENYLNIPADKLLEAQARQFICWEYHIFWNLDRNTARLTFSPY